MKKQTMRFDKTISLIESMSEDLALQEKDFKTKIDVLFKLQDMLKRKSMGEKIPNQDYEELIKISCPSLNLVSMFTYDTVEEVEAESAEACGDFLYIKCNSMNCLTCWKNFVNQLVDTVNKSKLDIKKMSR